MNLKGQVESLFTAKFRVDVLVTFLFVVANGSLELFHIVLEFLKVSGQVSQDLTVRMLQLILGVKILI